MLCQFSVKNFKSIKDEITLDMQATSISEHPTHLLTCSDNESFLPVAVIYGPNGGGKSNVLNALVSMFNKIMLPVCAVCPHRDCNEESVKIQKISPFKFSSESNSEPTEFELFFRTKTTEYKYNFSLLDDNVIFESLYKKNIGGSRTMPLFIRDTHNKPEYTFGKMFKNFKTPESKSILLLSFLAITYSDNEIINDIFSWFESRIDSVNYGVSKNDFMLNIDWLKKHKKSVVNVLEEVDIDIRDYEILERENEFEIVTTHVVDNLNRRLQLYEESSGTIKLMSVIPRILRSLSKGSALLIDELDAKLHPKLLKYVIELYTNKESNPNKAQLIFTSHDLYTMTSDVFRRDEIWFVAKNSEQSSTLYSLVEFKDSDGDSVRKDAVFHKQYLEGRYGADPYLRKIMNWEELTQ